jgi:DNA-binding transcriptional LysR family regulator
MFDLKQLQCFVAVGQELHFGRAAKRLHMTQPPLSRHIQLLEFELQIQLLVRTSRSVRLTPAGKAFLQEAIRILALVQSSAISAQRIAHGEAGLIRLGFTAGSSYGFLPNLLTRASASLKDINIVLSEMVTTQQVEALQSNAIDAGLQRLPAAQQGLETICVARERMMLAVPRNHRLAKGRLPVLADLRDEPFITFSPRDGHYFFQLIDGLFAGAAISPRYVQQISQIHSILALVSAGMGIAMVPESARMLHFGGSVLRQLKMHAVFADLHLVWRKDNGNPALPVFIDLVRSHFMIGNKLPFTQSI